MESPSTSLKESLYLKDELKGISGRGKKEMEVLQFAIITTKLPSLESFIICPLN